MQEQELHDRQKQEEYPVQASVQEILSAVRKTYTAQGNKHQVKTKRLMGISSGESEFS
jgi:hypothetical protein